MNAPDPEKQPEARHGEGMRMMADRVIGHYREPSPPAQPSGPAFPRAAMWGLGVGIVVGALLGALVAAFTRAGSVIAVPRAEQLQSMGDVTFYVFWILTGIAAGIALGGTATLLTARPGGDCGADHPDREDGKHGGRE